MTIRSETFRCKRNLALAHVSEMAGFLLKAMARIHGRRISNSPHEWRSAILLGADHIGDLLYRSSSLEALSKAFPECKWHFVAPPPGNEILRNNPYLAGVHASLAEAVATTTFDAAICYDTGTYWPLLLKVIRAGIPNRVAYVHKGFSGWVTHPIEIRYPQAFPGYFRDLVAQLADVPADWNLRPRAFPVSVDELLASRLHDELGTRIDSRPVITCFVTSRQPAGVWPAENYVRTLEIIQAKFPVRILFSGAPGDLPKINQLLATSSLEADVICGRLPLLALVAFLRDCDAVFSTDSGPRHLANAAGTPVFFVRNLSFHPVEAGAYCETDHDLTADLGLCTNPEAALDSVTPEEVAQAIINQLGLV